MKTLTAMLTLGAAMFSLALGMGLAIPLIPILADDLGAGGLMIGVIFAVNPLMRAALMPAFGRLSDVRGKKKLILAGLVGNAVAALVLAAATVPWHLLAGRILQGIVSAAVIPVALAYAGSLTADGTEGSVMGLFTVSLMAGFGFGPVIGGMLAASLGMAAPFLAMAVMTAISFLLVFMFVPEQEAVAADGREALPSLGAVAANPMVRGLLSARGLSSVSLGIYFTILPLLASRHLGLDSAHVGTVISVQILSGAPLQPLFGRLADRVDRVRLSALGLLIAPVAYVLTPAARGFGDLLVLAVVLGLSGAVFIPASTAIAVTMGRGMGMGSLMGLMEMALALGMALGAVTAGAVADIWSPAGSLWIAALATALAAASIVMLSRPSPVQAASQRGD